MDPIRFAVTLKKDASSSVVKEILENKTKIKYNYLNNDPKLPYIYGFASQKQFQEIFKTQVRYTYVGFDRLGNVKQVWQLIQKINVPEGLEKYIESIEPF